MNIIRTLHKVPNQVSFSLPLFLHLLEGLRPSGGGATVRDLLNLLPFLLLLHYIRVDALAPILPFGQVLQKKSRSSHPPFYKKKKREHLVD